MENPSKVKKPNYIEYVCEKIVAILREGDFDYEQYGEINEAVFQTFMVAGLGQELYVKLRAIISERLQKIHHHNLATFSDGHKPTDKIEYKLLHLLCRQWFEFSERMLIVRQLLLKSESVFENSVGGESLVVYAWRINRSILMDNSAIVPELILNTVEQSTNPREVHQVTDNSDQTIQTKQRANLRRSVSRRSLFSDDTLYDVLRFADTASLGLSVALCCRRFANFADFVLRGRTHSACALMLYDIQTQLFPQSRSQSSNGPLAVRLWDATKAKFHGKGFGRHINLHGMSLYQVIDQWFTNPIEQQPLELSEVDMPEWITGMRFLYLLDGVTPSVLSFLRLISPMLHNCCLKFELVSFWPKLHSSGLLVPFLSLFNPLTFSVKMTFDELHLYSFVRLNPHFYKFPLWATLHSIFFPNCYDLSLPLDLLSSREIGIDIAIWLHNERNDTKRPRRIVLSASHQQKGMHSMGHSFATGVNALIELIRKRFGEEAKKRHFIVESSTNLLNAWEERFLLNGNGECLLINPNRIVRSSDGNEHAKFEQFHEHLCNDEGTTADKGPTVQIGTADSVRWFKEIMAQMPKK